MSVNSVGSGAIAATIQSPEFSKSSQVLAKIELKVGQISDLFASLQAIIAELEALEAPSAPGEGALPDEKADYNKKLANFEQKLAQLNQNIAQVTGKLEKVQGELTGLQGQDLPRAEQEDLKNLRSALDQAEKAMEAAFSEVDDRGQEQLSRNDMSAVDARRQLRVGVERQQNQAQLVLRSGDGREVPEKSSEAATKMPPTPARGI